MLRRLIQHLRDRKARLKAEAVREYAKAWTRAADAVARQDKRDQGTCFRELQKAMNRRLELGA